MSSTVLENSVGMNFAINENQTAIADMIRKFGKDNIYPQMMEWDEAQIFPVEVFKKLGELGLMGVVVPEEYGGSGLSYTEYVTAIIELSKICGSIGLSMAAHNSLCTGHILAFGNEDQKKKYLPKLATAEWIGAWGLTETGTVKPKTHIMDNEASAEYKKVIHQICTIQLVPPNNHRHNLTERAIHTFKSHFIAIIAGVDDSFPMRLWDKLLPQTIHTPNLLRQSNAVPSISAYQYVRGTFD